MSLLIYRRCYRTVFFSLLLVIMLSLFSCNNSSHIKSTKQLANDKQFNQTELAHHTADGFKNLYVQDSDKGLFDFLRMRFLGDQDWADHFELADTVPFQQVDIEGINTVKQSQVTWLGHSTFLIQIKTSKRVYNFLSDPIFSDRASPISFTGPKRYVPHAMDYQQLPDIDWVIISHDHYDHLDTTSIQLLAEKSLTQANPIRFAVPLGVADVLLDEDVPAAHIVELDWWQTVQHKDLTIHALPSQHWSGRGLADRMESLWASWAIEIENYTLWFAGDTGYNDVQFKQIGKRFKDIDLALIPIGAYEPRWFMQTYHVDPAQAIQIHQDVGSKLSIGMHWGTFPISAEAPMDPPVELRQQKQKLGINQDSFINLKIGQTRAL